MSCSQSGHINRRRSCYVVQAGGEGEPFSSPHVFTRVGDDGPEHPITEANNSPEVSEHVIETVSDISGLLLNALSDLRAVLGRGILALAGSRGSFAIIPLWRFGAVVVRSWYSL